VRCHVHEFPDFLDDLQVVLDRVRLEHPGIPVSLVGHSMGGLVTAAFLEERQPAIANAVCSAPALSLGPGVTRARVLAAKALRSLLPRLAIGSGLDPEGLSRDPSVVRAYIEDPLVYRTMTASLAAALLDAIPRTAARASEVRVPLLMLHGESDTLCLVEGSRAFFAGLDVPGSDLRVYAKLRHEIFNEPEREQIYRDVLDWLEREEA
jgi:alpha-beta hydrolase superfamily lysophospholipase